jgi:hypothetical protein
MRNLNRPNGLLPEKFDAAELFRPAGNVLRGMLEARNAHRGEYRKVGRQRRGVFAVRFRNLATNNHCEMLLDCSSLVCGNGSQGAKQAVSFSVGTSREKQCCGGTGAAAVAKSQRPESING